MKYFLANISKYSLLLLLVLTIILACSCNANENSEEPDITNTPTGAPTENPPDDEYVDPNDGKLRIFADGKYRCKIVRPEYATKRELEVYVALRNMLKEITGVMPPISTDFLSHNESYDSNEFAILVGTTEYPESTDLYSRLTYSDFRAELVNKKYTLGFHDMDTASAGLEKLESLMRQSFKDGELILSESWNYILSTDEILKSIPTYDGGTFMDVCEGAYDMQTIIIENTSLDEYNAYLTSVTEKGFKLYTDNSIGENLFATFESDKFILTTMFFADINQVRVTMEYSGNYSLPSLKEENVYSDAGIESSVTQIGLEESAGIQNGMSYVVRLSDGSFIVFDGGTGLAKKQFVEVISSLADDPEHITIAAWIITHAHGDHMGLILSVLFDKNYSDLFDVEQIIWSKVGEKQLKNIGNDNMDYIDKYFEQLDNTKIVIAHPGQVFYLRNAVYTVYSTIEMVEPFILANLNDSCVVGRLEIDGKSLFFPGDSHPAETEMLTSVYADDMKSDVVQVIHHGYQGGNATFYAMVDPITVFWPLGMKNYSTAESPNVPMKDWGYSAWLFSEEAKVENIYVAGSDVLTLLIKDLPSHSAVSD